MYYRSHTCGALRKKDKDKEVVLSGWVHSVRLHGNIAFLDIRDRYGITQAVLPEAFKAEATKLRKESVIKIKGKVKVKPEPNKKIETGEIEVSVSELEILNLSEPLPLDVSGEVESTEETRLKYRYLDLRRPENLNKMLIRHKAAQAARAYLSSQGFIEVETPMLVKSTPEGARDYVVPSRVNPGKFYALPQSPQLYKQILMVAGFDRYFQLAKCLRDEDLRIDRQPEHTQIDLEMSFVKIEDLHKAFEGLFKAIWKETIGYELKTPFQRLKYDEAIDRFGCDKPDLRFGLELSDVTQAVKKSDFNVLKQTALVKSIFVEKEFSRKEVDEFTELVKVYKAKGMVALVWNGTAFEGSSGKFFSQDAQKSLAKASGAVKKGTLFMVADTPKVVHDSLAALRNELGKRAGLYKEGDFKFCWITDFPLFEWNEEEKRWEPAHHMFCMPKEEDLHLLEKDPGKVYCTQYDLVLNGLEMGSGSIRINRPEIQERVMKVIGLSHEEAMEKFGFLLEAFRYGAPPHGGIGIGFDRVVAMLQGISDIREVIAFPKNKKAECPMDGSPSRISRKQLDELHLNVKG